MHPLVLLAAGQAVPQHAVGMLPAAHGAVVGRHARRAGRRGAGGGLPGAFPQPRRGARQPVGQQRASAPGGWQQAAVQGR